MDLLGDIAGIYELILGFIGAYMNLFSQFSFTSKAIKKMYLIKTTQSNLFQQKKEDDPENALDANQACKHDLKHFLRR